MNFKDILSECGDAIAAFAPENVLKEPIELEAPQKIVEVVNGENTVELKESVKNRLNARNKMNNQIEIFMKERSLNKAENVNLLLSLKEETVDAAKSWILMKEAQRKNSHRHELQKFTNGGAKNNMDMPGSDINDLPSDGVKGGPSAYEAWRSKIVGDKRAKRIEQEEADRNSPFASPKHTDSNDNTLDDQRDEFLEDWLKSRRR